MSATLSPTLLTPDVDQREATAQRLIRSSVKRSFDPNVDVDWDRPFDSDKWFNVPEHMSLYGTSLWDGLSRVQQIELSKHEFASVAETGIWFEIILMRMLMRLAYQQDPRDAHTQYAFVETADECRHSQMFSRFLQVTGVPRYGPGTTTHRLGPLMTTPLANDAVVFGGTLYVEAILDAMQRTNMADDRIQPMAQQICRIHVIEEARHMRYADEEMIRVVEGQNRAERFQTQVMLLLIADLATKALINPKVYASVGLDIGEAKAAAAANPHWRQTLQFAATKPLRSFEAAGLLDDAWSRAAWRRIGLLGPGNGVAVTPAE